MQLNILDKLERLKYLEEENEKLKKITKLTKSEKIISIVIFLFAIATIIVDSGLRLVRNFTIIYTQSGLLVTIGVLSIGIIAQLIIFGLAGAFLAYVFKKVFNKIKNN